MAKQKILEKIESAVSKEMNPEEILNWFNEHPPTTSKGAIYLRIKIKNGVLENKSQTIKDIWINEKSYT